MQSAKMTETIALPTAIMSHY